MDRSRTWHPTGASASPRRGALGWALIVVGWLLPAPAGATTADDLCPATTDPCRVTARVAVTPGSIIDFGTRRLIIANRGTLDLAGGTMTVRAGEFTIEGGGTLEGRGSGDDPGAMLSIMADAITIGGNIDASGSPGGTVVLTSTGPVLISGPIEVRSRSSDSGGGSLRVRGSNVTITASGRINALGSAEDFGGDVDVTANGALSIATVINTSGGDGGSIDLTADGALTIGADTVLNADATAGGGSGGDISVQTEAAMTMDGELTAAGRNGSVDTGAGDGGTITLDAASITITDPMARLRVSSGGPDGVGGDVDLSTSTGVIDFHGKIEAQGTGVEGSGGLVSFDAIGAVSMVGEIDAGGGRGGGGNIDVVSDAAIDFPAGASLTVEASSSGDGGDIDISSEDEVRILGSLNSDGGPAQGGSGGSITVVGCNVMVDASGHVSSLRGSGSNTVIGRDAATIAGTMRADAGTGRNQLRYPGPEYRPAILPGANVDPPASLIEDASVVPCNPVNTFTPTQTITVGPSRTPPPVRTSTATRTALRSRSATPTVTPTPVPCVGDCDGSSSVSISDLITCVNISLGGLPLANCPACDPDGSGTVSISELIRAVNNSLNGCTA